MIALLKQRRTSSLKQEKIRPMKNLSFLNKLIFILNSFFAALLLLGYLLPYIAPSVFPRVAVLSLLLPLLIGINFIFFIYWLVGLKRQILLSAIVLLLGLNHIGGLYHLDGESNTSSKDISILSYNVRTFNRDGWTKKTNVRSQIYRFIQEENPDIVSFQEYSHYTNTLLLEYPYHYKQMKQFKDSFGQIIYSKFPIVNSGAFNFENTGNNIIYVDIAIKKDTVRIYNLHLESLRVSSQFTKLQQEDSKRLLRRIGTAFKKQEEQVAAFIENEKSCPYPVIVTGDFNNSSTSYIYRKIKGEKEDAFAKAGAGTGRTFTFDFIPLRIDFILTDPTFEVTGFENYSLPWSDHEPIKASLKFRE